MLDFVVNYLKLPAETYNNILDIMLYFSIPIVCPSPNATNNINPTQKKSFIFLAISLFDYVDVRLDDFAVFYLMENALVWFWIMNIVAFHCGEFTVNSHNFSELLPDECVWPSIQYEPNSILNSYRNKFNGKLKQLKSFSSDICIC